MVGTRQKYREKEWEGGGGGGRGKKQQRVIKMERGRMRRDRGGMEDTMQSGRRDREKEKRQREREDTSKERESLKTLCSICSAAEVMASLRLCSSLLRRHILVIDHHFVAL